MKHFLTEDRKKAFPILTMLLAGIVISYLKRSSLSVWIFGVSAVLVFIIFLTHPSILKPIVKLINLIIKVLSYSFTVLLIFLMQCVIFLILRGILILFRKRLFDMRFKTKEESYYLTGTKSWEEQLKEPY